MSDQRAYAAGEQVWVASATGGPAALAIITSPRPDPRRPHIVRVTYAASRTGAYVDSRRILPGNGVHPQSSSINPTKDQP